jgi:hypothetical protein
MPRYLWHFDADGWPNARIGTLKGQHVPVFSGQPGEMLLPPKGGCPMICIFPRVIEVASSCDWLALP